METFTDIELWDSARKGDSSAFEAVYDKYWEQLYSICYWHIMDQEAAQDIVQDLFVDLWRKKEQIQIEQTLESYLRVSIKHRVFNYIRSAHTRLRHYKQAISQTNFVDMSTEQKNNERELRRLYQEEISKLPLKMKEVYVLNKEQGLSIEEVAQKLSLSEQTVKNQLSNAMKKIRSGLESYKLLFWLFLFVFLYFSNNV